MSRDANSLLMSRGRKFLFGIFVLTVLTIIPVSVKGVPISPGTNVSLGDSGLDISQAIGTSTAIAWWEPGADTTNSPPSKVILIANNVTNFSINAGDFVEHPGSWYQYNSAAPNRAGKLVFVVSGYCGTDICPKPIIVSSAVGKEEAQERLKTRPTQDDTTWYSDNIIEFVTEWNEKMHWGLTTYQIEERSQKMNTTLLAKYRKPESQGYLTVPNRTQFCLEVGDALGLPKDQSEAFAQAVEMDRQNRLMRDFESHPDRNTTVKDGSSDETIPVIHTQAPSSQVSAGNTTISPASDNPLKILTSFWDAIVNATGNVFRVS